MDKTDYCGSQGSKLISWLVPDKILGVDLSECCKNHDISWENRGANKVGDIEFREQIRDAFYLKQPVKLRFHYPDWVKDEWLDKMLRAKQFAWNATGFCVAWWYFIGVRFGGIFYKLDAWIDKIKGN